MESKTHFFWITLDIVILIGFQTRSVETMLATFLFYLMKCELFQVQFQVILLTTGMEKEKGGEGWGSEREK